MQAVRFFSTFRQQRRDRRRGPLQIVGNVVIGSQSSVTITGGSGSTFGNLTGGTIAIGNGDLTFGGGNSSSATT